MTKGQSRARAEQTGRWAERLAAFYLTLKGYRVLTRRFKSAVGEVDLIASKGKALVFIEVKWRKTLEGALESVRPHQQRRIEQAAKAFCAQEGGTEARSMRFDVVALAPGRWPRHIRDAWRPARPF